MVAVGYKIRDGLPVDSERGRELAERGRLETALARKEMPGIAELVAEYGEKKPLLGARIAGCLHLTVETAVLVTALRSLGASVRWCSCNVFSTEDHAAAYLASEGFPVFAWKGMSEKEYWECIADTVSISPDLIIDDGGDMTKYVLDQGIAVKGVAEETTTGVRLLKQRESLPFPAIAVNDLITKSQFDNRYGCRESLLAGLMQGSGMMIGGKVAVVAGYGDVGRGCVEALSGLGARVVVTEIDPIAAYRAVMEGFEVMTMDEAALIGDLFITATGCVSVIEGRHLEMMKDGALLANIGHFDWEIDVSYLMKNPDIERVNIKPLVDKFAWRGRDKCLLLLGEGRLVNLSLASGHPSFVMSNSFCGQILAMLELWKGGYSPGVHKLPRLLDEKIARLHLKPLGAKLTTLTRKQAEYLGVSIEGPFKT
ncbi:adenosylhomocysteinase [Estrella lausannensis]|uniref:Adenosylhomocysteinase n=1 Tax=Estrella lausannensis TaxID=483423 RepID=A0A0H5DRD2_9BACT|nr:adenosylhomocysteinase [Estrella lausannensis]CRX39251.1 Adenosylhomocysteinase [Estrella lausannensis]